MVKKNKLSKEEVKKENERILVGQYKNNAGILKQAPYKKERLKQDNELMHEKMDMDITINELQIKDLNIRTNNFTICEPKFLWETCPDWINNQKDMIVEEIKQREFNIRMHKQSRLINDNHVAAEIETIKEQENRIIEGHKSTLELLAKEHNWKPEQLSVLKKECNGKCCR